MENINGGYAALVVVGVIFLSLQVWWISMTISNGRTERVQRTKNKTDQIKSRLEKIFYQD